MNRAEALCDGLTGGLYDGLDDGLDDGLLYELDDGLFYGLYDERLCGLYNELTHVLDDRLRDNPPSNYGGLNVALRNDATTQSK